MYCRGGKKQHAISSIKDVCIFCLSRRKETITVFCISRLHHQFDHFIVLNMSVSQDSKKYFKRADLARKEQEDYFRRCGYKVDAKPVLFLSLFHKAHHFAASFQLPLISYFLYDSLILQLNIFARKQIRPGLDAQVYISLYICVYCAVFPQPASTACICRFRERLLRARYGFTE